LGTRWRDRLTAVAAVLLLTVGINGVLAGLADVGKYAGKSFIEASGIDRELGLFIQYLSFFELAPVTYEEAERQIRISRDHVEWYRREHAEAAEWSAEEVRQAMLEERKENLRQYFDYLDRIRADYHQYRDRYAFYFTEAGTGQVHTNLDAELKDYGSAEKVMEDMLFVLRYPDRLDSRLSVYRVPDFLPLYREEVEQAMAVRPAKQFTGWIGVPKSDGFLAQYEEYRQHRWHTFGMIGAGVLILALLPLVWRRLAAAFLGPADGPPSVLRAVWRGMPLDVRSVLLLATGIAAFTLHREAILPYDRLSETDAFRLVGEPLFKLAALTAVTAAFVLQLMHARRLLKEPGTLADAWRKSLIMRFCGALRDAFLHLRIGAQAVLLFIAVFGLGFAICAFLATFTYESPWPWVLPLMAVAAVILYYVLRQAGYLNRLLEAARDYAAGRTVGDIPVKGRSVMAELADHWNRMRQGAEASRASEARSERLKTELITNVSHDLRTPLTSVITYVDLLKNPGLSEEERANYLEIIDRKSKRLKALIDDLFEATKMASGSVELNRERVDLVQLLEQALAESGVKEGDAGFELRVRLPERPVYAFVDGQKVWRVFDNLISNIMRYSLEGTRAYITLARADGHAEITFKNVSKYELGENVDELLERFKRGDASRHTEGSGLGLAIAKSIVDLHGGKLELEVDGDLFKVKVRLPEA